MIHTVSTKTAQLLKDAGFPQETHFWWISTSYRTTKQGTRLNYYSKLGDKDDHYRCASLDDNLAAPIAEEILNHMPGTFRKDNTTFLFTIIMDKTLRDDELIPIYIGWFTAEDDKGRLPSFRDESLAEVTAESWLYLKKEGVI